MKKRLKTVIEDNSTTAGKIFDYSIQILIFISLISFTIGTFPDIPPKTLAILNFIETLCTLIFTIEYVLRIYVSQNALKYILSFYGLIDLLAILPFYLKAGFDFKIFRAFRIFRIFRALKLVRYNKALNRFHIAAGIVKEEIVLFLMVSAIFVFLASSGIYYFENEAQPEVFSSVLHGVWWAVVTLTTVGYGDVYPITVGGKIFTLLILVIGVGIITVPAGLISSALSKARELEEEE